MKTILALLMLVVLTGCSGMNNAQRVGVGVETYIVTTNAVTSLSRTDRISLEGLETFETFRSPAEQYLKTAVEDVLDGDDDMTQAGSIMDMLQPILDAMIQAQLEAESNG